MKSVTVGKNDAGQRMDRFLLKNFPALPQSLMYKYLRCKRIKRNGKRAAIGERLEQGDVLDLYINDELLVRQEQKYQFLSAGKQLTMVYEDENILLLDKPAGLLCHADKTEYNDTLIDRVCRYLYEKGEYDPEKENTFAPALANRIDRNTAGIVIAAKNAEALRILNEKIKAREISKYYLCLVHGIPKEKAAVCTAYLSKDSDKNTVKIGKAPFPGGRTIQTGYRVLRTYPDHTSLLEVELFTGRTHQIRAHLAFLGYPLVGEGKYAVNAADKKLGFKHQALCSYKLTFVFPTDAGLLNYLKGKTFQLDTVWFAENR